MPDPGGESTNVLSSEPAYEISQKYPKSTPKVFLKSTPKVSKNIQKSVLMVLRACVGDVGGPRSSVYDLWSSGEPTETRDKKRVRAPEIVQIVSRDLETSRVGTRRERTASRYCCWECECVSANSSAFRVFSRATPRHSASDPAVDPPKDPAHPFSKPHTFKFQPRSNSRQMPGSWPAL